MKTISNECIANIRAQFTDWQKIPSLQNSFLFLDSTCCQLRSINDITEDEAKKGWQISGINYFIQDKKGFINYVDFMIALPLPVFQYLMQIGIALPYYDLESDITYSVEDLVELGVYSLENN